MGIQGRDSGDREGWLHAQELATTPGLLSQVLRQEKPEEMKAIPVRIPTPGFLPQRTHGLLMKGLPVPAESEQKDRFL
jgi:hypothetical protein